VKDLVSVSVEVLGTNDKKEKKTLAMLTLNDLKDPPDKTSKHPAYILAVLKRRPPTAAAIAKATKGADPATTWAFTRETLATNGQGPTQLESSKEYVTFLKELKPPEAHPPMAVISSSVPIFQGLDLVELAKGMQVSCRKIVTHMAKMKKWVYGESIDKDLAKIVKECEAVSWYVPVRCSVVLGAEGVAIRS
jgi:hypothetical protein